MASDPFSLCGSCCTFVDPDVKIFYQVASYECYSCGTAEGRLSNNLAGGNNIDTETAGSCPRTNRDRYNVKENGKRVNQSIIIKDSVVYKNLEWGMNYARIEQLVDGSCEQKYPDGWFKAFEEYDESGDDCVDSVLSGSKARFLGTVLLVPESEGELSKTSDYIKIVADESGVDGNSIVISFDGSMSINQSISQWNENNPDNTASLLWGDGDLIPMAYNAYLTNGKDPSDPYVSGTEDITPNSRPGDSRDLYELSKSPVKDCIRGWGGWESGFYTKDLTDNILTTIVSKYGSYKKRQKMRYKIQHRIPVSCYLKVWVRFITQKYNFDGILISTIYDDAREYVWDKNSKYESINTSNLNDGEIVWKEDGTCLPTTIETPFLPNGQWFGGVFAEMQEKDFFEDIRINIEEISQPLLEQWSDWEDSVNTAANDFDFGDPNSPSSSWGTGPRITTDPPILGCTIRKRPQFKYSLVEDYEPEW